MPRTFTARDRRRSVVVARPANRRAGSLQDCMFSCSLSRFLWCGPEDATDQNSQVLLSHGPTITKRSHSLRSAPHAHRRHSPRLQRAQSLALSLYIPSRDPGLRPPRRQVRALVRRLCAVPRFAAPVKGHVAVLDHVSRADVELVRARRSEEEKSGDALQLSAHGEDEEDAKVEDEDRPVDGNIKDGRRREEDADDGRARRRQPGADEA
jgi:hypothetical protein